MEVGMKKASPWACAKFTSLPTKNLLSLPRGLGAWLRNVCTKPLWWGTKRTETKEEEQSTPRHGMDAGGGSCYGNTSPLLLREEGGTSQLHHVQAELGGRPHPHPHPQQPPFPGFPVARRSSVGPILSSGAAEGAACCPHPAMPAHTRDSCGFCCSVASERTRGFESTSALSRWGGVKHLFPVAEHLGCMQKVPGIHRSPLFPCVAPAIVSPSVLSYFLCKAPLHTTGNTEAGLQRGLSLPERPPPPPPSPS